MNKEQFWALFSKGAEMGSKGVLQSREQNALDARAKEAQASELAKMIKGKELDSQMENAKIKEARAYRDAKLNELIGRHGKEAAINVSDTGISYNPEAMANAQEKIRIAEEKRIDDKVKLLGDEVQQSDLAGAMALNEEIFRDMPKKGEEFKSAGPVASWMPNLMIRAGEMVGMLPKGAVKERNAFEAVKQIPRHKYYGAVLPPQEAASFEATGGFPAGASDEELRANLERVKGLESNLKANIGGQFREEVKNQYKLNNPRAGKFLEDNKSQQDYNTDEPGTVIAGPSKNLIKVKLKSTGQIGTLDHESEFDPSVYERVK